MSRASAVMPISEGAARSSVIPLRVVGVAMSVWMMSAAYRGAPPLSTHILCLLGIARRGAETEARRGRPVRVTERSPTASRSASKRETLVNYRNVVLLLDSAPLTWTSQEDRHFRLCRALAEAGGTPCWSLLSRYFRISRRDCRLVEPSSG